MTFYRKYGYYVFLFFFFFYYCICDTTGFYARITFVHCQPNGTGQEKDYESFRHDLQGAYTNEFLNMNDDISIFFNDKKWDKKLTKMTKNVILFDLSDLFFHFFSLSTFFSFFFFSWFLPSQREKFAHCNIKWYGVNLIRYIILFLAYL